MEDNSIISPVIKEILGYGILGVYALVVTYVAYRFYRKLTEVFERLINKKDSRRDQEAKVMAEISGWVKDLSDISENLVRTADALDRMLDHAKRGDTDERDQRKR